MEEEKKGFSVKDKRIFDESGDVRKEEPQKEKETKLGEEKEKEQVPPPEAEQQEQRYEDNYPEVNFASFVISLSTSAMYHFGDFPDPATKEAQKNLSAAKQTIDILGMLKMKTEGNLDENEKSILEGLLYELRLRYVKEKTGQ
ncbi:MAG: hypothetical protein AUK24_07675 [Syntrophaceae bacterium CG2_30_49_12]|nr:MAG: hypothetical protein AUK24_07675 [Syntrophaceae bacterium CG2_30_49_12]PIP05591.1 MAG: hypothetical protein COX52_11155 [Syntrophobacterales bacterium CG23_combo_of_CG06-09_8_20_14_all_48_27]PJC75344.1 MAG: DUF1844 domain-containing protein [Syntrophobacterales bacterium CG_4_8_14_3_um_filter_49_14]